LLLLKDREIWVRTSANAQGERLANCAFDACSGKALSADEAPDLSDSDWSLNTLQWQQPNQLRVQDVKVAVQAHQLAAKVNSSEKWLDPLPANPGDFIGRTSAVSDFKDYLSAIANGSQVVRIIGVKANSGWGKSSFVLKVCDEARKLDEYPAFILPVDCRAAVDFNFADLAFKRLLSDAENENFILPIFKPEHEFIDNPFSTNSYQTLFKDLISSRRIIGIIFDQFEEIIHVDEHAPLFKRLWALAHIIDDMKGPIFIGFSWKTDGSIASDNRGYQLWHGLNDRRKDFSLRRFDREDSNLFIRRAASAENVRITNRNVETLVQQSNGFPWLLKKLTVQLLKGSNAAVVSRNISELDIREILENDLDSLSEKERATINFIAHQAPIDSYLISEKFGDDALNLLLSRRLIVRSGNKLSIYWDIFREYIVSDKVPTVPTTYVHTLSFRKLLSAIRHLASKDSLFYSEFANLLSVSETTADNAIRDLANIGILNAHRSESYFVVNIRTKEDGLEKIRDYVNQHAIFRIFMQSAA
jgi:hypothetical protein